MTYNTSPALSKSSAVIVFKKSIKEYEEVKQWLVYRLDPFREHDRCPVPTVKTKKQSRL
jgi:hypothetical protein